MSKIVAKTSKFSDLPYCRRREKVCDCRGFFFTRKDPFRCNRESQIINLRLTESTLSGVEFEVVGSEAVETLLKISEVVHHSSAVDEDVVHVGDGAS